MLLELRQSHADSYRIDMRYCFYMDNKDSKDTNSSACAVFCWALFTTACLYKTPPDIVLKEDRKEGAIIDFIAIVSWVYCYILKTMHLWIGCVYKHLRMYKCRSALTGGRECRSDTDFTLVVHFIFKNIHSSACTVGFEYLYKILHSFTYNFILIRARQ